MTSRIPNHRSPKPSRLPVLSAAVTTLLAVAGSALAGDDWPQFRGPNMNPAVADNPALPDRWSQTENVEWVTEGPPLGWSSPVVWGKRVFLTTATSKGGFVYGDIYYSLLDRGFFEAYDARTGKEVYGRQRISERGGASFTSSPWAYNGKVFALSEQGDTYVIKAGTEFEVLGINPLDEMAMASPAIVGDRLLIRSRSKLYSIRRTADRGVEGR